jgi:hypothetical protein
MRRRTVALGVLVAADLIAAGVTWLMAPAVAVLLVAAPLGYVVARHVPLLVSRWVGRRQGITHVGASADRALPRLRQLVIEVEHIITTGNLVVVDVLPIDDRHRRDLRWFAGALAHGSTDPVARAIARLSGPGKTVGVSVGPAHELQGAVDRHPVRIGVNGVDSVGDVVGTTVRVDVDLRLMGHITVADEVRPGAARCLTTLRDDDVEPILTSTSLGKPDLARVSDEVGVADCHPDVGAAAVASTLPSATTGTLCTVAAAGSADRTGELTLPAGPGEDTVVTCADPSIETALRAIRHVRGLRQARRAAQLCAAAVVVAAAPLAALRIISPAYAAAVALVGLLLVAAVAATTVLLHSPEPASG